MHKKDVPNYKLERQIISGNSILSKIINYMQSKKYLLLVLLFLSTTAFSQTAEVKRRIQQVENGLIPYVPVKGFAQWTIADRMKYHKIPGASIAVIKDFKIDWAKSYGLADTTLKKPASNQTVYSAGSVSKLLMAFAAMRMVEQGKINLDSPINNYLKSWKLAENDFTKNKPVTLRMLLSHTGGTSQSAYFGFTPDKKPLPTIVEIVSGASISEARPVVVNSEPGKEFRYSGGGSMVAQLALMDITGKDFNSIISEQIFEPLGLKQATFQQPLPASFANNAASAYSEASWFKGMPYVYPQQAAAGLYSNATNLATFIIEMQKAYAGNSKLMKKSTVEQMLIPVAKISEGSYLEQIGLGAFLLERTGNTNTKGKYFEHQGVNAGFVTYAMGSVEDGNGIVIMMNSGDDFNGFGMELRRAVAQVYGWHNFLPEAIQPIAMNAASLDKFTGRYRMADDEVLYLRREKKYLVENINQGKDIYCFPTSKDSIVFTDFNVKGFFYRDTTGNITGLRNEYQEDPMPKMNADEFSPSEHLLAKRYAAAKEGYAKMNMNEYQLTYLAYDLFSKKQKDLNAVKAVLELAQEKFPNASIVFSRWGDYYLAIDDKSKAIKNYQRAMELDPNDENTKKVLDALLKQ